MTELLRRQCDVPPISMATLVLEKATKAARVRVGQQIWAKIKRSSKYFGQGDGGAFEVFLSPTITDDYCVQGGPGGQYRLTDVNLYVISEDGRELKIS